MRSLSSEPVMSIKSDKWIRRMALEHGMIEPFEAGQVRHAPDGHRIVSYGTSSYGYDIRCSNEFKIFTNVNSTIIDPKHFDEKNFAPYKPGGEALFLEKSTGDVLHDDPTAYCLPDGFPREALAPYSTEIIMTPELVIFRILLLCVSATYRLVPSVVMAVGAMVVPGSPSVTAFGPASRSVTMYSDR